MNKFLLYFKIYRSLFELSIVSIDVKKLGQKTRSFYKPGNFITGLLDTLTNKLVRFGKLEIKTINRKKQSSVDIKNLSTNQCTLYGDLKDCFNTFNVHSYSLKQNWIKRIFINWLFSAKIDGVKSSYISLRGGLKTSVAIMEDINFDLQEKAKKYSVSLSSYVDDHAFYAQNESDLKLFLDFSIKYFGQYNLKFHSEIGEKFTGVVSLDKPSQRLPQRIGLQYFKKDGQVFSKIRPKTKRKFLLNLESKLRKTKSPDERAQVLKSMLYGKYGLYYTWPKPIWNSELDRTVFKCEIYRIYKRYNRFSWQNCN